jgi:hypothetical protein
MKGKKGPKNSKCNYRGVRQRAWGKWVTEIWQPKEGKRLWLGTFSNAMDVALTYDEAARTCTILVLALTFQILVQLQLHPTFIQ